MNKTIEFDEDVKLKIKLIIKLREIIGTEKAYAYGSFQPEYDGLFNKDEKDLLKESEAYLEDEVSI